MTVAVPFTISEEIFPTLTVRSPPLGHRHPGAAAEEFAQGGGGAESADARQRGKIDVASPEMDK